MKLTKRGREIATERAARERPKVRKIDPVRRRHRVSEGDVSETKRELERGKRLRERQESGGQSNECKRETGESERER